MPDVVPNRSSVYCGFDPTADFLHLGNYLQIVTVARAAQFSLQPIFLVGGATARIGDPSFRQNQRKLLTGNELKHNTQSVHFSIEKLTNNLFTYMSKNSIMQSEMKPKVIDNIEFHEKISFLEFLTKYGFHLPMATMLRRESVSKRLGEADSLTFAEFSYQMIQAADFAELAVKEVSLPELCFASRRQRSMGKHTRRTRTNTQITSAQRSRNDDELAA